MTGDSAGGHLTLSILSHILHPHPSVPEVLPLSSPLAAAVLISPWVTVGQSSASFTKFGNIDCFSPQLVGYWGEEVMGKGVPERELAAARYHAEAMLAPENWWEGLDKAVKFIGTTAGGMELFVDDIVECDRKIRAGSGVKGELYIGPRDVHNSPLLDFLGGRPPSETAVKVAEMTGEGFKSS